MQLSLKGVVLTEYLQSPPIATLRLMAGSPALSTVVHALTTSRLWNAPDHAADCSDTISPNRVKNFADNFLAVPAISRLPS